MRKHYRLSAILTLEGPILTRGDQPAGPGIDAPVARAADGRPMLPYSHIKGKVRSALGDMGLDPAKILAWLGRPSGDAERSYEPERGRLHFGDMVTNEPALATDPVIERVEIDAETGAAAGRMLAMIESPFAPGQRVPFEGGIDFLAEEREAPEIRDAIDAALRWTPSYGGNRTVGFGRTLHVQTRLLESPATAVGRPAAETTLAVRWTPDRPFCLVGRKHSGNHFESLDVIPGSVLKGCVARLILERGGSAARSIDPDHPPKGFPTLGRYFEVIRFSEARPMPTGTSLRPVEPPLSLVVSPGGHKPYYDVALEDGPLLIGGRAPAFAPDWKGTDFATVRRAFGWSSPPRTWRTRTAIDEDLGRAKDQLLFSYGLVVPSSAGRSFHWESTIGLERIPAGSNRANAANELHELLAFGLPGVGKTRAAAAVEWVGLPGSPAVPFATPPGGVHVLTLQTDALLTDPRQLIEGAVGDAYRSYWHEVSGGSLELVRHFARQELHGGFLARRARHRQYEPFLVTLRGSAFVVRVLDARRAEELLATWGTIGLPTPSWVATKYSNGEDPLWKTCPFRPDVGFGEVAIDLECHIRNRPGEEESV